MRPFQSFPILLAALALAPRVAEAQGQAVHGPATCKVVYVLDGDTINCDGEHTVRLLLVDVPDHGNFGDEARAYVVGIAPRGTELRLEYDQNPRDSEGRWLAYAFLHDGTMINKRLVENGFAYVEFSSRNQARLKELRAAEQSARGQGLGLWSQ